jgi:hypothetical protein
MLGASPLAASPLVATFSAVVAGFDYEANKENYSRYRVVYVSRRSTTADRTVLIAAGPSRTVYVAARPNENTRTVLMKR